MEALNLLLVDYAMPSISGAEVIRAARQARPDLPTVLMTGYADADALGEDYGTWCFSRDRSGCKTLRRLWVPPHCRGLDGEQVAM